jgi:NAD(P)H-hydrate epimerase
VRAILTPSEAAQLDRATQARGIPAEALMERAGEAVARAAVDLAGGVYGRRAVVVSGKGNNGGDGFVAARHLARWGMRVVVLALEPVEDLREPAAANALRLRETDARLRMFSPVVAARELARADVAIDAIFGTGFRGAPEDSFAEAIDALIEGGAPVVAVDIPSGVNGETGAIDGEAVWADATIAFGAEKPGTVLLPGAERSGFVDVADIGFPEDLVAGDAALVGAGDVAAWLPARELDSHKRATGVILVVGGSRRMTGAMRLVGTAAYRIGAGLVTLAVPTGVAIVVQQGLAEAIYLPLPEDASGALGTEALAPLLEHAASVDAVAIGPGMGRAQETADLIRAFVRACPAPMVIDADALNAFEGRAAELAERRADAVLTPHTGEFSRLAGIAAREIEADRLGHVRKLAADTRAAVLLKGSRTVIGSPDGPIRICATGTPVLATAGSGDVLTGTIGGLLARGLDPLDAASAGAFLHGVAGRIAGSSTGEGTIAGDVAARLPGAVAEVLEA